MAIIYFTSNASTGAGSLVEAIKNASPGDVIRPDETVFERGSTIEIVLASTLNVDKSLTLDGGPYRVRLDGDGLARCCNVASGVNVEITSFDIVGGGWNSQTGLDQGSANGAGVSVAGDSSIVLKRCGFFGCRGSFGGGLSIAANATAELSDCVIVGCYARGSGAGLRSQGLTKVYSSTIIGNVGAGSTTAHDVLVDGSGRATFVNSIVRNCSGNVEIGAGCVVGVTPSQIGFVAPPPDDLSAETWNANAWRNWDLRLLDDASPNPSPYRDAGDVDAASKYDYQGNFRGRESEGVATCSPGAFETIQADLFWVGRDATGAEVVSPSWLNANGWAASRFATSSGDVAPQKDDVVFVDGDVSFDGCGLALTRLIVGGYAAIRFAASGTQTLTATFFDVGVGAFVESTAGTQKLGVRDSFNASRFGEHVCVDAAFSSSSNAAFEIAPTARFKDFANSKIVYQQGLFALYRLNMSDATRLDGDVANVENLTINSQDGRRLTASGGPRIACKQFSWGRVGGTPGTSSLTDGSTPLVVAPTTKVAVSGDVASNDFSVDVSRAEPDETLALTLTGQTVYSDAPSSAVEVIGNVKFDVRGLTTRSLTFVDKSTVSLEKATIKTKTLSTLNASPFIGCGHIVFPTDGGWNNDGATLNGVVAENYDAASNDIKIVYEFDAAEIRNAFNDGVCRWTSKALDAGTLPFVFGKYSLDAQGKGDYREIYNSTHPILDAASPVYETNADWDGDALKTVVHATPEAGWNYYRVEVPAFANLGGAKIYHGGATTRYFVFWNADYEPEPTYYYVGGAKGSFKTTSDWALTADGVAKFEGAPTSPNATFVISSSALLRDCPSDHVQISVVFPSVVDVYNSKGRRLSDAEARLVSLGVPTPPAPEFYVGQGGTSGFWEHCDGATLYRVEAFDGSSTGLTTTNRWLDKNELQTKTWRVRVAAPIYGGVEKWSTQTAAVRPFSALVEKANYDDATAENAFELLYADDFDGVRDASIVRTGKNDKSSTLLAQNFSGGEFTDAPSSFDEYVYRVAWTPSPENVWLETTAAPWSVADGFDATTQINFITTPNRAYETPTFAARIEKKSNGELMKRQDVAKISYSLFETRDLWATRAERLAVGEDGSYWRHNVEISAATVRDSLLVDPNFWSLDEIGANFVFSPEDGRPFFPRPGAYLVRATLETTNGRRIVVEFSTQVE